LHDETLAFAADGETLFSGHLPDFSDWRWHRCDVDFVVGGTSISLTFQLSLAIDGRGAGLNAAQLCGEWRSRIEGFVAGPRP
jgi:hypothetical protein